MNGARLTVHCRHTQMSVKGFILTRGEKSAIAWHIKMTAVQIV